MSHFRHLLAALFAVAGFSALPAAAGAAAASCSSVPAALSQADPVGDGPFFTDLDATGVTVSLDAACVATFNATYEFTGGVPRPLYSDDAVIESTRAYIDSDGSVATGSVNVAPGSDWVVVREKQYVGLFGWVPSQSEFALKNVSTLVVNMVGDYGVSLNLTTIAPYGSSALKIQMSGSVLTHDGTEYDFVPDGLPAAAPLMLTANLTAVTPPAPPVLQQGAVDPKKAIIKKPTCTVPTVKRSTLARAKKLLRKAKCGTVKVLRRSSAKIKRGRAVRTKPTVGSVIDQNTTVVLVISSGKPKKKRK